MSKTLELLFNKSLHKGGAKGNKTALIFIIAIILFCILSSGIFFMTQNQQNNNTRTTQIIPALLSVLFILSISYILVR